MTTIQADNCMICAKEYLTEELKSIALSTVNITKFKICNNCLNQSDPKNDYQAVKAIVNSYFNIDNLLKK